MISAATDEETGCTNQREFHPHPHIVHHLGVLLFPLVRQSDHLGLAADRKIRATEGIRALGDNARTVFNEALKGKAIAEQEEWMIEKLGEHRQSGDRRLFLLHQPFVIVIKLKNSRNKS